MLEKFFYRLPFKQGKYYWMTLCCVSDKSLALYGDKDGIYYNSRDGIFHVNPNLEIEGKIIVEKIPGKNEVKEVLTGQIIPMIIINIFPWEKNKIVSKNGVLYEEYNHGCTVIGDTSSFTIALALDKKSKKGHSDEEFELKEASKKEIEEYRKEHMDNNSWTPYKVWHDSLEYLIQSGKKERKRILEENKELLQNSKNSFFLKR